MRLSVFVLVVWLGSSCSAPMVPDGGAGGSGGGAEAGGAAGGGGGGGTPNAAPQPVIAPVMGARVGEPVFFDGTGSSDPEGDVITHAWDFGDGTRANGPRAVKRYARPGTFEVTLTTADAPLNARSTRASVTIAPGPTAQSPVAFTLRVRETSGAFVADALVSLVGGSAMATSNAQGVATLQVPRDVPQVVRVTKSGYAPTVVPVRLFATQPEAHADVTLQPQGPVARLDATQGGAVMGPAGARLELPPGVLRTSSGQAVSGMVDVAITPVDVVRAPGAFPGSFEGLSASGDAGLIASLGTADYALSQAGQALNLAPGATAVIDIPLSVGRDLDGQPLEAGGRIELWSLDELTGGWVQEGDGEVVIASGAAAGFALRARVGHFSWWNADKFSRIARPRPRCCIDGDADGMCDAMGNPAYCWVRGTTDCASWWGCRNAQSLPVMNAQTFIPGGGGMPLLVGADRDFYFIGESPNSIHRGVAVYRGAEGNSDEVLIRMTPTGRDGGAADFTIPGTATGQLTAMRVESYRFTAQAGDFVNLRVSRPNGDPLEGTFSLTGPNGYAHRNVAFGFGGTVGRVGQMDTLIPATGDWLIEVAQTRNSGAFTLTSTTMPRGLWVQRLSPSLDSVASVSLDAGLFVEFSAPLTRATGATALSLSLADDRSALVTSQVIDGGAITLASALWSDTTYELLLSSDDFVGATPLTGRSVDGGTAAWVGRMGTRFRTENTGGVSLLWGQSSGGLTAARFDTGWRLVANLDRTFLYTAPSGWTSFGLAPNSSWPCLAQANGRALVVRSSPIGLDVHFFADGGTLRRETLPLPAAGARPACALNRGGEALVLQTDEPRSRFFAAHFRPDAGWQTTELADGGRDNTAQVPRWPLAVALTDDGLGLAAWQRVEPTLDLRLEAATWTPAGWRVASLIEDGGRSALENLAAGASSDGGVVVAWSTIPVIGNRTSFASQRLVDGGWSSPETLTAAPPTNCAEVARLVQTPGGLLWVGCAFSGQPRLISRAWNGAWAPEEEVLTGAGSLRVEVAEQTPLAILTSAGQSTVRAYRGGAWSAARVVTAPGLNGPLWVPAPVDPSLAAIGSTQIAPSRFGLGYLPVP